MKTPRIYCDTSVFGGVYDDQFAEASRLFFELIRAGTIKLVVSPVVGREIEYAHAPEAVKSTYLEMLAYAEIVDITDEAIALQQAYVQQGIVSPIPPHTTLQRRQYAQRIRGDFHILTLGGNPR